MFYAWLYPLRHEIPFFNLFGYITFRTGAAVLTALFLSFVLTPPFIAYIKRKKLGQVVRNDGPESHLQKTGTPTFGGIVILLSALIPTLLWTNLNNHYIQACLFITGGYGLIGFLDDYLKFTKKNPKGLAGRYKLTLQFLFASVPLVFLYGFANESTLLLLPFLKNVSFQLGIFYIVFALLVIVGASNAVNLTDGLDGLAIGTTLLIFASFAIYSYLTGHAKIAAYLYYPFIRGSGELTIFCGAMVGSSLAFLWYNTHPAEIFMGDVGSLPLGGAIGSIAVFTKHEILLVVIGGVLVIEALSVITQVGSFKLTGKRIWRMAPIHHHFELKGWAEPKVIVRFWIGTIVLCMIGFLSIKVR